VGPSWGELNLYDDRCGELVRSQGGAGGGEGEEDDGGGSDDEDPSVVPDFAAEDE